MNIFNLSFGKDSMATLLLALEQGIKVDRVMYCEIRFDDELSGEKPLMAEWIPQAEKTLREKFGVVVDHAYSGVTFCEQFYRKKTSGNHIGEFYGFPYIVCAWCNGILKIKAILKYLAQFKGQEITHFVGIAVDEPKRWARMQAKETGSVKYRSLLVEQKLTEQDAVAICKRYNLLSPIYVVDDAFRGGCWFCPKQCMSDLHSLWKYRPDLYAKLLAMEPDSHNTFKPGTSLAEITAKFESGYSPKRKKTIAKYKQISIFDWGYM